MTAQDIRLLALEEAPPECGGMIRDSAKLLEKIEKMEKQKNSWLSH